MQNCKKKKKMANLLTTNVIEKNEFYDLFMVWCKEVKHQIKGYGKEALESNS